MAVSTHGNTANVISDCGTNVNVPNTAAAYLRYYVNIACTLLEIDDDDDNDEFLKSFNFKPNMKQLRNYSTLRRATREENWQLVLFALTLSPDELIGEEMIQKCLKFATVFSYIQLIYEPRQEEMGLIDDGMCGNQINKMLAVSQVKRSTMLADTTFIRGQTHTVKTVMAFKPIWLVKFWITPMKAANAAEIFPDKFAQKMAKIRELIPSIVSIESEIQFELRPPDSSCCAIL